VNVLISLIEVGRLRRFAAARPAEMQDSLP